MINIEQYYHFNENEFKKLLKKTFKNDTWLKVFLADSHHGFIHGNQVRLAGLKLIENLSPNEKRKLLAEGKKICRLDSYKYAIVAMEIAAIFHDCGRFNNNGQVIAGEQKYHHILSAKRAKIFCNNNGLSILIPNVEQAILGHDFQSRRLTPDLNSPKNIIGKIVQSSDQLGWFHPDSIYRTLDFSKALGVPFYDPLVTIKERLAWVPMAKTGDAFTVMLSQLFGPMGKNRFGIEYARQKVEKYKKGLEQNILKIAQERGLKKEINLMIKQFKNKFK